MIGFCLSVVSPAVVVPCLLALQSNGFGVEKGVPTLVMASASCNDVIAIGAFTIILGVTFNPSADVTWNSLQAPLEVFIGLGRGILWAHFAFGSLPDLGKDHSPPQCSGFVSSVVAVL